MTTPERAAVEPISVDAAGAGALLGMSERLVRTLTAEGKIPTIDLGDVHDKRLYSVEALRRWALAASGYTRDKEVPDDDEAPDRPADTHPAEGRKVGAARPGRSRKPRSSSAPLPLRIVER